MDLASIIGIVGGLVLVIFGIITGDQGVAALGNFLDYKSAIITFGGTLTAVLTMAGNPKEFISGLKSIGLIMKPITQDEAGTIKEIIELSNVARKEGLLALEESAGNIEDEFLKKGILLIVDGTDPELVRSILETEIGCIEERHKKKFGFWDNMASMGPAWGMIGTLIGLINMLKQLDDPSAIGPSMAVALITTLYGSMLANWIATPTSNKLKENNAIEIRLKEVMVEGLLSIQAGENPRVIEEKLKSFLAPNDRAGISEEDGENIG
ncbi:flagellar motor rotation protein MotA [Lachnospiraceae bacterium KM106-2]|nr:flagellar motor rotation protein MotA [Lachnospiraceae bacterium KM106-2]